MTNVRLSSIEEFNYDFTHLQPSSCVTIIGFKFRDPHELLQFHTFIDSFETFKSATLLCAITNPSNNSGNFESISHFYARTGRSSISNTLINLPGLAPLPLTNFRLLPPNMPFDLAKRIYADYQLDALIGL